MCSTDLEQQTRNTVLCTKTASQQRMVCMSSPFSRCILDARLYISLIDLNVDSGQVKGGGRVRAGTGKNHSTDKQGLVLK